ncbi:MAG: hypothetical protein ACOY3J_06455 [Bacillota bacterium]
MNERLPGFLKPVNNAIANITQRFDDSALGKFIHRGSQTANAIGFGADNENRPSTGNKVADITADVIGGAAGIFAPNGLGKFSMMASEAAKVPQFASKMASKIKSPAVANVAKGAIENAGAGTVYGITEGIVNDRTPGEIAGNIALDAVIGAGVGIGIEALRPVVSKVLSRYKGMPINPETVEREVAKDIGVDWDNLNDRQKDAIRKVVTGMQTEPVQSGRLLYPAQEFTFRNPTLRDYPGNVALPAGKAKIFNKERAIAEQKLKEATEYLQNYFRTNELRVDEMEFAKNTLGIDLEKLADDVLKAEQAGLPNFERAVERGRIARAAGIEMPALVRGRSKQAPVPVEPLTPLQFKQTIEVPKVYDRSSQQNDNWRNWEPPEPVTTVAEQTAQELYNADGLRDLSGFRLYSTDIYRNFRDVFGPHFEKVKKAILDPFDASKKANVEMQREWARKLKEEVVDRLGIQKGSELSALVQRYGEKNISLPELQKLRPKDWQKVVEADRWFRWAYDQLLNEVNAVRAQIYPNNPEKIIPRRQDYYRHFRELADTFEGVKNLFETPSAIDPSLAGRSEFTLPKSKFLSFAQKRGFGPYKEDAVGGFLNYLPAASYAKHIDPHIGQFERLAAELAGATEKSRHLNNFIEWLRDYARDLAGKTNPADRFAQKIVPGGRTTFKVLNWLNSRIKANVVMGNISSSLSQIANVPQGIAFAKQYSIPGFKRTVKSIFQPVPEMAKSGFLTERFSSDIYRQFDTKLMDQPKKFAAWMLEVVDKVGTEFIWNSVYEKALAEGIPNPIKYADDMTRSLVAGRGIGEVPILQKSKIMQLVAPFTLEVSNLWKVQKDFVKARDFGGLVALYVANFMLNKAMEATRGSGVVFDPIDATIEALTEEDISPLQRAGRLAGEVVSNLPLGSTIASIYPEYGTDTLPTRKELFGRNDPTRFGPGLLAAKGLSDPLYKVLPGFGGGQIQKTVRGVSALAKGGAYTSDGTKLKYPVKRTPANIVRGVLFGQYSFPEAKEYYENNRRPLGENQTQMYQKSSNPDATYRKILREREIDKINRQISELNKDKSLSLEQKREKYQKLVERRKKLMQGG